jgi:hypothetical protein
LRRFAKQIATGILCSCIAGAIYRGADTWRILRYACSLVVHVGGDPLPEFKKHIPLVGIPGSSPLHKSPDQLAAEARLEEAKLVRKQQSERNDLEARAERLKLPYPKDWTLEKLRLAVQDAEREAKEAREKAEDMARKKPWIDKADGIGFQVDQTMEFKTLKQQVEQALKQVEADTDYQTRLREWERAMGRYREFLATGPNARCLNPKCRYVMRINNPKGQAQCKRCLEIFPRSQVIANWTPPAPPAKPQPRKSGLLQRILGR